MALAKQPSARQNLMHNTDSGRKTCKKLMESSATYKLAAGKLSCNEVLHSTLQTYELLHRLVPDDQGENDNDLRLSEDFIAVRAGGRKDDGEAGNSDEVKMEKLD